MMYRFKQINYLLVLGLVLTPIFSLLAASFTDATDGLWNDGATWGNTSPGVMGIDWPGASDDVTISTYTVTLGSASSCNDLLISGGVLDTDNSNNYTLSVTNFSLTAGNLYLNASTMDCSNNFESTSSNGVVRGTSTINITGTGDITSAGTGSNPPFYNLSVAAAGQTTTIIGDVDVRNHLTIGSGTFAQNAFRDLTLYLCPGNPLTYGGGNINFSSLNFRGTKQIPGIDYGNLGRIRLHPSDTLYELQGNTTIKLLHVSAQIGSSGLARLDTKGYDLTCTSGIELGPGSAGSSFVGTLIANNSTINAGSFIFNDNSGPGDTLYGGTADIHLTGRWENLAGGVFDEASSTVSFEGTATQDIQIAGVTGGETFNDLVINNSKAGNAVVLSGNINVSGELTLTDGHLITTSSDLLTVLSTATLTLNAPVTQDSSFVKGPVAKVGSGDFIFPVGKDKQYRPIEISSLSGSETFTAEYIHSDPHGSYNVYSKDPSLDHISRCEYWTLDRAGSESAYVTLSWNSYSCGVTDLADLRVARWDGSQWKDLGNGGTTGNTTSGTIISASPVTSFGPFALSSISGANPLPIILLSFTATLNESQNIVNLQWTTSAEINNDFFTVERSFDGYEFEVVNIVEGAGNSNKERRYNSTDNELPASGKIYYRLKWTDYDGMSNYSSPVAVTIKNYSVLKIYPNPVKSGREVHFIMDNKEEVQIGLINELGEEVFSTKVAPKQERSGNTIHLPSSLAAGLYYLHVKSNITLMSKHIAIY